MSLKQFLAKYGEDSTTNFQLIKWAKELGIKPFYCIMRNELEKLNKAKQKLLKRNAVYIICNYQTTKESGTHWIAMYRSKEDAFYFDSYGIQPFPEAIDFLEDGVSSTFKIQKENQKLCGQLSLYVLFSLSQGKDFYDIVLEMYNELGSLNKFHL